MDILHELYYGNLRPFEHSVDRDSRYGRAADILTDRESRLRELLGDQGRALLDELTAAGGEMDDAAAFALFREGFRLGAQLLLAALAPAPQKPF